MIEGGNPVETRDGGFGFAGGGSEERGLDNGVAGVMIRLLAGLQRAWLEVELVWIEDFERIEEFAM